MGKGSWGVLNEDPPRCPVLQSPFSLLPSPFSLLPIPLYSSGTPKRTSMTELRDRVQAALGDDYRIERELGGGGMSRLFLAEERQLHRSVVVQLPPREYASEIFAARFRKEIELAAHLQHPNILPVLTAGTREGLLYYIVPYLPGESLRHRLTRGGLLPVHEAVEILSETADALAHAHTEGILHRDIKPENILLEGR